MISKEERERGMREKHEDSFIRRMKNAEQVIGVAFHDSFKDQPVTIRLGLLLQISQIVLDGKGADERGALHKIEALVLDVLLDTAQNMATGAINRHVRSVLS